MARADRPGQQQQRPLAAAPPPEATGEDDITGAWRLAHEGTTSTRLRLTRRGRATALGILAVILLVIVTNAVVTGVLGTQLADQAVEQADQRRLNGASQEQARKALEAAQPANARLQDDRLFPVPLPRIDQAPAATIIANAASVQVLADMPRAAIVSQDYVALGQAVARFYARNPVVTASGPSELQVQQLCVQYMIVASRLVQVEVLPR